MIRRCMESWEKVMPDFEVKHWTLNDVKDLDVPFLKEALECEKWAFAADYTRLYALYTMGGIYLDTDVEVFKNFSPLLNHKAFIGRENSYHMKKNMMMTFLTSHCMGAEKGHPYIKACLDYYKGRHFITSPETWLPDNLKYDQRTLPFIQSEIGELQGYSPSRRIRGIQIFGEGVYVYPYYYFDCHNRKKESYCKHLAMGSWRNRVIGDEKKSLKERIKPAAADLVFRISGRTGLFKLKDAPKK